MNDLNGRTAVDTILEIYLISWTSRRIELRSRCTSEVMTRQTSMKIKFHYCTAIFSKRRKVDTLCNNDMRAPGSAENCRVLDLRFLSAAAGGAREFFYRGASCRARR